MSSVERLLKGELDCFLSCFDTIRIVGTN